MAHMMTRKLRHDVASEKGEARRDVDANKADGAKEAQTAEVHQHAVEIQDIPIQISECQIDNIMHAAKIQRLGEQHV